MDPKQQPREQPAERLVAWSVVCLALFTIAVYIGYRYDITLWDWLKLLVVPVVIAGVGIWFNRQQRERELEIAERRTQDEALQAYLDVMSQLLTDEKRPLRRAQIGDSLSSVARARTLTVLPRLDGGRKGRVVQFLYEAGLIAKGRPILDLLRADLRGADLNGAGLRGADLNGAHLSGADLRGADLKWADLSFADLSGADLRRVDLLNAVLSGTVLRGADLRRASLRGAQGRTVEQLRAAKSLEEATMPDGKILRGEANPDGPTFDEWVKDRKDRKGDAENA
jgi:Pentapeptide repeats (8 copies)